MKAKTKNYVLSNIDSLKYLSDEEIQALIMKRFSDPDYEGVLNLIAYQDYQESHAFTLAELGL